MLPRRVPVSPARVSASDDDAWRLRGPAARALAEYQRRKREAEAELAGLAVPAEQEIVDAGRFIADLRDLWAQVDLTTRRDMIQAVFEAVYVDMRTGRVEEYRPKAAFRRLLEHLLGGASRATPMGFEPTISTVTGWHVRPLHHGAEGQAETCSKIVRYPPGRVKRSAHTNLAAGAAGRLGPLPAASVQPLPASPPLPSSQPLPSSPPLGPIGARISPPSV